MVHCVSSIPVTYSVGYWLMETVRSIVHRWINSPLYRKLGARGKPSVPFSRLSERQLESTTGGMGGAGM